MLQGSLHQTALTSVIHDLYLDKSSGLLLVSTEKISKRVYFEEGSIIFASSDLIEDRLGEFLIRKGKITRSDFDLAYQLMQNLQQRLGATLVQMGYLSDEEMREGVTEQIIAIIGSLFAWSSGVYVFDDHAPRADDDILVDLSTANVILDGARLLTDFETIRGSLGELGAVLRHAEDGLEFQQELNFTPEEAFLLSRVDGLSTITEMVSLSPLGEDETLRCMNGLLAAGILEKEVREAPSAPARDQATRAKRTTESPARIERAEPSVEVPANPSLPSVSRSNLELAEVYYQEGQQSFAANRYSDAVQSLREAARLDPFKIEYHRALARSMGKLPELRKEAKERFEYAIRMDPSDAGTYVGLGELCEAGGQAAWAKRMYRKAQSLDPQNNMAREKLHGKGLGAAIGNLLLRAKRR